MLFNSILLASAATSVFASPLAVPEPEAFNDTVLSERQVATTNLYAVWNTEKWETTVAPGVGASDGGEEVVISGGFSILTDSGQVIYTASDIEGYAFCINSGRQFEVQGNCFAVSYKFSCASDFAGDAGSCAVWGPDPDGEPNVLEDCEEANNGVAYTAFTAGSQGQCVVGFQVDGDCNPANAQAEWQVGNRIDDVPPPCDECPSCS